MMYDQIYYKLKTSASVKTDASRLMVPRSQNYFRSSDNHFHFRFDENQKYCRLISQFNCELGLKTPIHAPKMGPPVLPVK